MPSAEIRIASTLALAVITATSIAPAQSASDPRPDALIQEWHQHWARTRDGGTTYHERRRVKLLNDRAYGAFADPRITYDARTESVEIIAARVRTPDGRIVDTPAYSRNEVSPSGPAGWPAFASLRQIVLTLSGIEPGCVTDVEYRIVSRPERRAVLAADLRLDHEYPIALRTIRVDEDAGTDLASEVTGLPTTAYTYMVTSGGVDGPMVSHRWEFTALAPAVSEPQSPPWQAHSPRLCFTTANPETWAADTLHPLATTSESDRGLAGVGQTWAADAVGDDARVRAVQKRFAETFNFVDFDVSWRPAQLRPAAEVFASGHGLPEECLAVFLGLAGPGGRPGILVADNAWSAAAPQTAAIAAWVAVFPNGDGQSVWHPQHGPVARDARWAGHTLHWMTDDGTVGTVPLASFADPTESELSLAARIRIGPDGTYTGTAAFTISGLFLPAALAGDDGRQKDRVRELLGRVLPKLKVESLRVRSLAPGSGRAAGAGWTAGVFTGEATLASDGPLEKTADRFSFTLAADGPHTLNIAWPPLARSRREGPVWLTGAFQERVELIIEWPEGWKLEARPADGASATADWGAVEQFTSVDGPRLRLERSLRVTSREMSAASFLAIRDALNQLRTESARTLLLKP